MSRISQFRYSQISVTIAIAKLAYTACRADAVATNVVNMTTMLAQMKPPAIPPAIAGMTRTRVFGMNQ